MKGSHGIKKLYGSAGRGMGWRKNLSCVSLYILDDPTFYVH